MDGTGRDWFMDQYIDQGMLGLQRNLKRGDFQVLEP